MGKNFIHPSLGFFIERTRKQSGVTIETLCIDELEELDDDEIRKLAGEWVEKWLEARKKGE